MSASDVLTAAVMAGISGVILIVAVGELAIVRGWDRRWQGRGFDLSLVDSRLGQGCRIAIPIAAGLAALFYYQSWQAGIAVASTMWVATLSVATDLACGRVPREPAWANLAVGITLVAVSGSPAGIASAVVAFVGVALVMGLTALLTRGKLGSGDIRLILSFTPLAAWCGWTAILAGIALGSIVQFVLRPLLRRLNVFPGTKMLPFAPALVVGLLVSVALFGQPDAPCNEWAGLLAC